MKQVKNTSDVQVLQKRIWLLEIADTILEIFLLLVFFLTLQHYFVSPFIVSGTSMVSTLEDQELILVNRFGYTKYLGGHLATPKRGDVIVFRPPASHNTNEYYIKRVIGIPGDSIEITKQGVILNETLLDETYSNCDGVTSPSINGCTSYSSYTSPAMTVPEGYYYVMGDNRDASADSRKCFLESHCTNESPYKLVPYDNIVGTAMVVFWPFSQSYAELPKSQKGNPIGGFWPINNIRTIERLDPKNEAYVSEE